MRKESLPEEASNAVLIPIPFHRVRQRDRGFNQAQMIAEELAQQWNLSINSSLLKRVKYTKPQATLSIEDRQKNMYMAFHITQNAPKAYY